MLYTLLSTTSGKLALQSKADRCKNTDKSLLMARGASSVAADGMSLPSRTLIVDPGAYTVKAGFATAEGPGKTPSLDDCQVIPNCIARSRDKHVYVGSELERCTDFGEMSFRRPVEKGYIVNWEAERAIWEHEFLEKNAKLHVSTTNPNIMSNIVLLILISVIPVKPISSSPSHPTPPMHCSPIATKWYLRNSSSPPAIVVSVCTSHELLAVTHCI